MTEGEPGRDGGGPAGGQAGGPGSPGGTLTEDLLRARLHRAVAAVEPEPGALPRLRAAVPRRRAVRRRALGGAVVLAAAAAVLPVVNATRPFDLSGDPAGGQAAPSAPSSPAKAPGGHSGHPHASVEPLPSGTADHGPETSASPSASGSPGVPPAATPSCLGADLGRSGVQQAVADPVSGKVYGWFRLANTAAHPCRLTGPGAFALGTGAGGVQVLAHTAGDPADSLPDPAGLPADVLLGAGGSYLVRFAWVPARCPTASESPSAGTGSGAGGQQPPSAAPSGAAVPAALPAADTAPSGPPGPTLAAVAADPTPSPTASAGPAVGTGSSAAAAFTLAYTSDPAATGAPLATTLPAGCGGTVYWTGPEPAPAPSAPAQPAPSPTP
ncbi:MULTISPECIES: hypothetical protein [Kitasatospora]|uniref:DUF4232 domain-containing protein n=1 Tax=Kitasatospora setae (strain ATCC 33774 / DSM 43861 / JCM 3304 / KCC A-0304 / NBRC 14216 / KM-6054) TaxID=452652 RepID=E4NE35_KITSK|nr:MULTISPECIES: hypothetical protein [Kitasatospora]BAJ29466.1 hypothetical protein KSE_36620 [Kitasatospora setae KM-6054]